MVDKKYLKKYNLLEAHERFMRMSEAYMPTEEVLSEDDDTGADPNADPNAMGGDPNAMGADPNAMGGDPNAMGGDPNMMTGDLNADPNAMGADPNAMGDNEGLDDMEPEEVETIDIDGLTHAEEKLNIKQNQIGRDLSKVDKRITKLIDAIGNFQVALDKNNSELETLKAEFEKRNPTQTEKLNLRSLDSYPFNVKPTDYWEDKARQGGYDVYSDNKQSPTKEYVITNDDVDNPTKDIANTFFNPDNEDYNQTLEKLFGL